MENKINIAELLKDCPPGMELYSPLCGKCVFDRLNMGTIICKKQNTQEITFTSEGYYMLPVFDNCECMLFPSKDQRDWNKFHIPFKDGDIVASENGWFIGIIKIKNNVPYNTYCTLNYIGSLTINTPYYFERFATEKEKQMLFDAIKNNGYKWNAETKTLEKLIKPKFKVGDVIQDKDGYEVEITEVDIDYECYSYLSKILKCIGGISFEEQDDWELVPDKIKPKFKVGDKIKRKTTNEEHTITKVTEYTYEYSITEYCNGFIKIKSQDDWELVNNKFDIITLVPFESKILVRDHKSQTWRPAIWGFLMKIVAIIFMV